MNDPEQLFHFLRMNRARLHAQGPARQMGERGAPVRSGELWRTGRPGRVRRQALDEAFVELITRVDPNIVN